MDAQRKCPSCGGSFPNTAVFWYTAGKNHRVLIHRECPERIASAVKRRTLTKASVISTAELIAELDQRKVDVVFERRFSQIAELIAVLSAEQQNTLIERLTEGTQNGTR